MTKQKEKPSGWGLQWLHCSGCRRDSEKIRFASYDFVDKTGKQIPGGSMKFVDGELDYMVKYSTFLMFHWKDECNVKQKTEFVEAKPSLNVYK